MKKIFLSTLIFLSAGFAQAMTQGQFLGGQFMINMTAQNPDGSGDESPQKLFTAMNVPIQDSMLGPGKSLKTDQKIMNFICANRSNGGYTCMLMLQRSASAQLGLHRATLELEGDSAIATAAQFFLDHGTYRFVNEEKTLQVLVTPTTFSIHFDEQGR
ncbi:MAG TPA: hypothetical protein VF412_00335 [Bdellovibrio sp.]|uniref:hypothetical protein n=1 Tax=Bdellovibrio sp. TaxID=28201 RepID=UPI002F17D7FC